MSATREQVSTSHDTKSISLTIYNGNFGVVREQRLLDLEEGANALRYENVAMRIDPTSISISSRSKPDGFHVLEQNYQYDILNPTSILNKSVGKKIRFLRYTGNGQSELIEGTLLNPATTIVANEGSGSGVKYNGLVIYTADGKLMLNPTGEALLDELPQGLVANPSLLWKLYSSQKQQHLIDVAYITSGMKWKADYVALLNEDDSLLDINGWVTIDNQCGTSYEQAQLQLIAGDVRKVEERTMRSERGLAVGAPGGLSQPEFKEESFFEYHLYTLDTPTDVRDNETKQLQLFSAVGVQVQKKLILDSGETQFDFYEIRELRKAGAGTSTTEYKAAIVIELKNAKSNNMGMPLPKGKVRLYKADSRGNTQFLGEDMINHTPKDETLRLLIGDAFDILATRVQTNDKQISEKIGETSFEISIRNHKEQQVEIFVYEHFYGDWEITRENSLYRKVDATTVEFVVMVEAGETKKLNFSVRRRLRN